MTLRLGLLFVLLSGCDSAPAPTDSGPDDAGVDAGALDAGSDAGSVDAGPVLGSLGAPCTANDECDSGRCVNVLGFIGAGTGYCSHSCADDAACADMPDDGYTYSCLSPSGSRNCMRSCRGTTGCLDGSVCLNDIASGFGTPADICVMVGDDGCSSDSDCAAPEFCYPIADRDRVELLCFAPRDNTGAPLDFADPGATCDPLALAPCTTTAECQTGYTCLPRFDGRRICAPPQNERCGIFCALPGRCSSVCTVDADCPTDMRCSLSDFALVGQNTPDAYDDALSRFGVCTDASGSAAACTADDDCAAGEVCFITQDSAGVDTQRCVTAAPLETEGSACGDDPSTTMFERTGCFGQCIDNLCGGACVDVTDCPAGWRCGEFPTTPSTTGRFCYEPPPCATDADCSGGDRCFYLFLASGFEPSCITPIGSLADGATCSLAPPEFLTPAARCSAVCVDVGFGEASGRCGEICATDGDCATADFRCGRIDLSMQGAGTLTRDDDVRGSGDGCVYLPGSRAACTRDADCTAGETCFAWVDTAGATQRSCSTSPSGGLALGATCDPATMPCASRMCLRDWFEPSRSFCTAVCASDADCTDGLVCRRANLANASLDQAYCLPPDDPRGSAL